MAIQDEIEKLRREWEQAGLNPAEFNAWRQGATHEEHLVEMRAKLERARREKQEQERG